VQSLKIGDEGYRALSDEEVEHYLPTILVDRDEGDDSSVFVLTEHGEFKRVADFREARLADYIRLMLPDGALAVVSEREAEDAHQAA
jgi:hypothetical protein